MALGTWEEMNLLKFKKYQHFTRNGKIVVNLCLYLILGHYKVVKINNLSVYNEIASYEIFLQVEIGVNVKNAFMLVYRAIFDNFL